MADGLTCPECGSVRISVDQTVTGDGTIIRRRRCAEGHSFVTEEAVCDSEKYNAWQRQHWRSKRPTPQVCGFFDCAGCDHGNQDADYLNGRHKLPDARSYACEHQCAEEQVGGIRCERRCGVVELPPMDAAGVPAVPHG